MLRQERLCEVAAAALRTDRIVEERGFQRSSHHSGSWPGLRAVACMWVRLRGQLAFTNECGVTFPSEEFVSGQGAANGQLVIV